MDNNNNRDLIEAMKELFNARFEAFNEKLGDFISVQEEEHREIIETQKKHDIDIAVVQREFETHVNEKRRQDGFNYKHEIMKALISWAVPVVLFAIILLFRSDMILKILGAL